IAPSSASWFITGSAPGSPRQRAQTWVLGGEPNFVEQPQKTLDFVDISTWVSSPMTVSNSGKGGPPGVPVGLLLVPVRDLEELRVLPRPSDELGADGQRAGRLPAREDQPGHAGEVDRD